MDHIKLDIPVFQAPDDTACCGSSVAPPASRQELPGYKICRFVDGFYETCVGKVPRVNTRLNLFDRVGTAMVRLGLRRDSYSISPGLYCAGSPGQESTVLVTANYKLSFDCLRQELAGQNVWILVLDTRGVNVWCAAAHKTFGTAELLQRISVSCLAEVVSHRQLIVPQLGAPGVDGLAIHSASGFEVLWGPLRAEDISSYLANSNNADPAMRKLTFKMSERLVLAPVELAMVFKPSLIILAVMLVVSGFGPEFYSFWHGWSRWLFFAPAYCAGLFSGIILVPALLPWLPFRPFYLKGILAGLPVVVALFFWFGSSFILELWAQGLICLAVSSYLAMNFTGATPYVSPSGVEKEMRRAIPVQGMMTIVALLLWLFQPFM